MGTIQVNKLHTLSGHRDAVYAIERSQNDHEIFSAGGDGIISLWDLNHPDDGQLIAKLQGSIFAIHRHPATNYLVVGQNFEGIHLLDYLNKNEIASLKTGNAYIFDIQSIESDILIALGDGTVQIVDIDNWTVMQKLTYSDQSARSIAIDPMREVFAVGYSDQFIRVFSLLDYSLLNEWHAHANSVFSLKYTPDGHFLLSGSRDAHLKVWDRNLDYHLHKDIVAHMHTLNHIEFSPDSKHFVTCSMDKSIKVWDRGGYNLLKVIDKARYAGHGTSVNKLKWLPHNNQLVSASDDRTLSIWEIIF